MVEKIDYSQLTRPTYVDKELYSDFKAECKRRKTSFKDELESLMTLFILGVIDGRTN